MDFNDSADHDASHKETPPCQRQSIIPNLLAFFASQCSLESHATAHKPPPANLTNGSQALTSTQPSKDRTFFLTPSHVAFQSIAKSTTALGISPAGSPTKSNPPAKKPWLGKPTIATAIIKTMPVPMCLSTATPNLGSLSIREVAQTRNRAIPKRFQPSNLESKFLLLLGSSNLSNKKFSVLPLVGPFRCWVRELQSQQYNQYALERTNASKC